MHQIIQTLFFIGFFVIAFIIALPCKRLFNISDAKDHQYKHLDGIRALAALSVVGCHSNQYLLTYFGIPGRALTGDRIGIIGVQIFFTLTAYLFTKKALENKLNPNSFYMARVRRIAPLYLVVASITVIMCSYLSLRGYQLTVRAPNDPPMLLKEIFDIFAFGFLGGVTLNFGSVNALSFIGIAWTLSYEWKFYLVLPLLYSLYRHSMLMATVVVLSVLLLAFHDFYVFTNVQWPFFIIGSFSAWLIHHYPSLSNSKIKSIFGALALLTFIFSIFTSNYFDYKHFFLTGALFISILIAQPRILAFKPLLFLGQISYSIYLLQYLVLFPVQLFVAMHPALVAHSIQKFIVCFSIGVILIPAATLSYKLIELPGMEGTFWRQFAFIKNLAWRKQRLLAE
ncbi:acyltransferase family protein [Legionella resiliens]|uniref:Acyltransferase n=1 Tax=Legionella resiliens TaxID=2905958 RepID=A0ABS8WYY7_9GAMM|nr:MULTISPECIES: acyltransferase [unclassified Legionella]MCE0721775.1 acyltransferase [Legionella sp. 9fVS26]MCE3530929.1 acyltransferase [Legionella sp. 8cVS16]